MNMYTYLATNRDLEYALVRVIEIRVYALVGEMCRIEGEQSSYALVRGDAYRIEGGTE